MRPARSSNNKKRSSLTKEECLADASGNLGSDISISALIFSPSFFIICRYFCVSGWRFVREILYFVFLAVFSLFYAVGFRSCESH